jgi:hypothetical protein
MNTNALITMLATGAEPVMPNTAASKFAMASGWGLFGATLAMAIFLGVRSDIAHAVLLPMFWAKLLVPATAAIAALGMTKRLACPGLALGRAPAVTASLLLLAWVAAAVTLAGAAPAERAALVFGSTWKTCPFNIALLSLAPFAGALWAVKGLAPTRLRLAGASAGLLAGATAAAVYALHCPEMSAPFLGIWYVLGIAIPTAVGWIAGPQLLEW